MILECGFSRRFLLACVRAKPLVASELGAAICWISRRPLDLKAINDILKYPAELAGLDPTEFSAHGLLRLFHRSGANGGIPLPEAMEHSRHRSVQQASVYNHAHRRSGRASRLLGRTLQPERDRRSQR